MNIHQNDLLNKDIDQDIWWDEDDLVINLTTGQIRLKNAYPTKVKYNIDSPATDDVVMVGNTNLWFAK